MHGLGYLIRVLLFCSSYIPLVIIFSIRSYHDNIFFIPGLVIASLLFLILLLVILISRKLAPMPLNLTKVEYKSSDLLTYMFSYVFPFLNIDFSSRIDILCIGVFFVMLALVYVNSNLIYINPMLSVMGFRLYQVTDSNDNTYVLIIQREILMVGSSIQARLLGGNILISLKGSQKVKRRKK